MDTLKPVSFPKLNKSRLVPNAGQSELDWVSVWGKKNVCVAIFCVWVRAVVVVMVVWFGGSVGVLMRSVWRSLGVGMGVLGGVGVCLGCGWGFLEFWPQIMVQD